MSHTPEGEEGQDFKAIIQENLEEGAREIARAMDGTKFSFQITPRAEDLGGGFRLQLLEGGEEMGGGVFPGMTPEERKAAHAEAVAEGEAWLASR